MWTSSNFKSIETYQYACRRTSIKLPALHIKTDHNVQVKLFIISVCDSFSHIPRMKAWKGSSLSIALTNVSVDETPLFWHKKNDDVCTPEHEKFCSGVLPVLFAFFYPTWNWKVEHCTVTKCAVTFGLANKAKHKPKTTNAFSVLQIFVTAFEVM